MNFNNQEHVVCAQDDTLGGRMSLARDALDVSAQRAARIVGVETSTWFNWENDRDAPRANRLAMIAGVLSVSLSWLLTGRGQGPR
ncbi:helix-turn-helix domain-containing protein [Ensifer sp.]|uniref:helix-turn-helix domain-containing protein n=1 Tax=Ensifer sp. TaxID=1872086 RepID=UPI000DD5AFC5|nr:helix-turn-helix domain-containing protein [Ensifer sp.]